MGLDEFMENDESDTSKSGSSSSSSNTSTTSQTKVDNTPSYMKQAFSDFEDVSTREIKYQIKSVMPKFTYGFSMSRFDTGELIAYSMPEDGVSVVVFTTIQAQVNSESATENKPIKVVEWDFENEEEHGDSNILEYDSAWDTKLRGAILDMLD